MGFKLDLYCQCKLQHGLQVISQSAPYLQKHEFYLGKTMIFAFSPSCAPNALQEHLGCFCSDLLAFLGALWVQLGHLMGSTWASWPPLGLILGPLARLFSCTWCLLGASWANLGPFWVPNGCQVGFKAAFKRQMGAKWVPSWSPNGRQVDVRTSCQKTSSLRTPGRTSMRTKTA